MAEIYFLKKLSGTSVWSQIPLFLFIFLNVSLFSQSTVFKAGASISNVTPPLGMILVGEYNPPPSNYVHDQLHARTLVLNDGEVTLVFVIVDNVGIPQEVFDAAKAIIHNKLKIEVSNILMASTHTHSGPSAGKQGDLRRGWHYGEPLDPYQSFLAQRIADGVQTAVGNLEPANIAWGSVDAPEHVFNRRSIMKDSVWNPLGFKEIGQTNSGFGTNILKPAGPTDPEISFIAVESIKGKPISVLANYSLHYVGGLPGGQVSADYFAVFADRVQELLDADRQDPPFVGIMSNGTSGDINNIDANDPNRKKYQPFEKMRLVAYDVADKVFGEYASLDFKSWVPLGAIQSKLSLKVRRASPGLLANIEKINNRPEIDEPLYHRLEKMYAGRILQMEEEWPDQIDIILQTFRIGDLGITAIPFEVFAETGLEIKSKSPFKNAFTIELANGNYGYLPSLDQHKLGGYETWLTTNKVELNASRRIVNELMSLFEQVK